ncbi:MAG: AraC family transcriptional regulator [Clostridia bacterium]|nr:AraC family transcriptional regulator [Clostridia bacterium]
MDFIVYGVDYKNRKGEFCQRSISPYYFVTCFRTDYLIEIDGKLRRGRAGDMYISRPNEIIYHGPTPEAEEGFSNDWLYLGGDDFTALLERYPLPVGKPFHVGGVMYLASAIVKIHRERSYALDGWEEKCDLIMSEAIIDLYRAYRKNTGLTRDDKLEYARGEMMKDFKRQWTLSELAKLADYSVSRFCALYKDRYGISPIDDLINHRISQAKLLLLYGNMPLSEISEAVGFSSIYYFSKHFKKKEGTSPTVFKRNAEKLYKSGVNSTVEG